MKRTLLITLLLLPVALFAQKRGQARIDSLLPELPKMQEDTIKAEALSLISFDYEYINPKEGIRLGEQGLALSERIGWEKGIADNSGSLGADYYNISDYPTALERYLKALKIDEKTKNKIDACFVLNGIGLVYTGEANYPLALEYCLRALKISEETGRKSGMSAAAGNIGTIYYYLANYLKALEYYFKVLKIMEDLNDKAGIAASDGNIANVYNDLNDYPKAMEYYQKALKTGEELGRKGIVATNTFNIGILYLHQHNYPKALEYYQRSLNISQELDHKDLMAGSISRIGTTYLAMAQDSATAPADKQQWLRQSIIQLETAMQQTMAIGDLKTYKQSAKSLSDAYALNKQYDKALTAYQEYSKYKDSVFGEEKQKELTRKELDYEYSKREDSLKLETDKKELTLQKEIQLNALRYEYEKKQALVKTEKEQQQLHFEEELKRQQIEDDYRQKQAAIAAAQQQKELQRKAAQDKKDALSVAEMHRQQNMVNASLAGSALLLIAALSSGYAYRQKRKDNRIIANEKQKSEELLLNILPAEVAEELKDKGSAAAKHFDSVSVLFTDFVNFTGVAEHLSPTQLVQELHECFTAFDAIIERNGLEKIKTIGDAYMAVCGLPVADPDHAKKAVQAALEMRNFITERKKKENVFEIRVGVNSGSVVAGIVGVKKFAYDIWGDTVNTAARMEQHSEAGKVNISQATYELVKNDFSFEQRGKITAKNKGEIEMYFAEPVNKNSTRA